MKKIEAIDGADEAVNRAFLKLLAGSNLSIAAAGISSVLSFMFAPPLLAGVLTAVAGAVSIIFTAILLRAFLIIPSEKYQA